MISNVHAFADLMFSKKDWERSGKPQTQPLQFMLIKKLLG
jgi:hypothetical protein